MKLFTRVDHCTTTLTKEEVLQETTVLETMLVNFVQPRHWVLTNAIVCQEDTIGCNIRFQDSIQLPLIRKHVQKVGGGIKNPTRLEPPPVVYCEHLPTSNGPDLYNDFITI